MYNHNGNTIKSGSAGIDHMRYIRSSQLTSGLQNKSHGQVTFAYDNANNRILKHTSTETRLYILSQVGKPLIEITKDKEGNRSSSFMIYSGAGLCAIYKPQERQTYFPLTDHLHSTRAIWDGTSIVEAFNYLPFGDFMGEVYRKYPARSITHYLFTGQELEPETGLYNFKARFYDPASGRFYSIDPAGEYSSPYLYVGNDPINFYDPTGMFSWEAFGAIMGGIATIAGGILLTVLTAGAATPILVGAAIFGGALIGAGAASLFLGATNTVGCFN